MKIAIVGVGSVGTLFAAHLIQTGRARVIACVRSPIERVRVETDGSAIDVPVESLHEPERAEPVDWVLLATKTYDTQSTAPWLQRLCAPTTRVAVLQNGVDHEARVQPLAGPAVVVPAIVHANSEYLSRGHVRQRRPGTDLAVPNNSHGQCFANLFAGSGVRVSLEDDFTTAAWCKLLLNAAANPLTALTQRKLDVLREPETGRLALQILEEAAEVGRAEGARLDSNVAAEILDRLAQYPPGTGTSMLQDRLAGRPLEFEALTGVIVRKANQHGIPAPVNTRILELLRALL